MKKIFSSTDVTLVSFYKALLENNGISTIIKNYYLTSGVGDLPVNECIPELWVIEDEQAESAKELLASQKDSAWQCNCGEEIPGQFAQCWKCGRMRE